MFQRDSKMLKASAIYGIILDDFRDNLESLFFWKRGWLSHSSKNGLVIKFHGWEDPRMMGKF